MKLSNTDYQNQPAYIRAYRWLKHHPKQALEAIAKIVMFLAAGGRIPPDVALYFTSRWQYVKHIWMIHRSLAQCYTGNTLSMKAFLEMLKGEQDERKK